MQTLYTLHDCLLKMLVRCYRILGLGIRTRNVDLITLGLKAEDFPKGLMAGGCPVFGLRTCLNNAGAGNLGTQTVSHPRATPLGRSRYQTSEVPSTSEFPTELPSHSHLECWDSLPRRFSQQESAAVI